jgi:hypothetical protein
MHDGFPIVVFRDLWSSTMCSALCGFLPELYERLEHGASNATPSVRFTAISLSVDTSSCKRSWREHTASISTWRAPRSHAVHEAKLSQHEQHSPRAKRGGARARRELMWRPVLHFCAVRSGDDVVAVLKVMDQRCSILLWSRRQWRRSLLMKWLRSRSRSRSRRQGLEVGDVERGDPTQRLRVRGERNVVRRTVREDSQ